MSVPTLYGFPSPEGGGDALGGYDYHYYYEDEDEDYDHVATDDYGDRVCTK